MNLDAKTWLRVLVRCWTICFLLLFLDYTTLPAAPVPDSGSLLRDIEESQHLERTKELPEIQVQQPRPEKESDSIFSLTLNAVKFVGNQSLPSSALEGIAAPYIGRPVTFADLQQLIAKISRYYRQQGFMTSRAFLPAQEIVSNKLEIRIIEGKLDTPGFLVTGTDKVRLQEALRPTP